ncbi:MAG TPA: NUDIX domain-containing protein [Gemmatimonadales bacterium]|nr:NUDIX domain-containing protein [Gemmatimonadales bacterium]
MTRITVSLVDAFVLRGADAGLEALVLRRAPGGRCPGSWETVHGHIEEGEAPFEAALREVREETGLDATRLYNLSRVETFYMHRRDEVALVPVFAAFVPRDGAVTLGEEHDAFEWLPVAAAGARYAWPRERRGLEDVVQLVGAGDAGALEDVLRVC